MAGLTQKDKWHYMSAKMWSSQHVLHGDVAQTTRYRRTSCDSAPALNTPRQKRVPVFQRHTQGVHITAARTPHTGPSSMPTADSAGGATPAERPAGRRNTPRATGDLPKVMLTEKADPVHAAWQPLPSSRPAERTAASEPRRQLPWGSTGQTRRAQGTAVVLVCPLLDWRHV